MSAPSQPLPAAAGRRVAIIGGGWAGLAAAVALTDAGHHITLWETARHWGGRARSLALHDLHGQQIEVDNGQHILIGAYTQSLALMRRVGVAPDTALLRRPLDLRDAQGQGLQLSDLPPPWDALWGIARARGWRWSERAALLAHAARWQRQGFRCGAHQTVAELCSGLPPRLLQDFIDPLCLSALNLPASQASGTVFLRVLRDSLFAGRGGSHLLIPRRPLGQVFPEAAAAWLQARGARLHLGRRVHQLQASAGAGWSVDGEAFDAVVLATSSMEAARLVLTAAPSTANPAACEHWAACADTLPHTAIATVYAQLPQPPASGHLLAAPMVALHNGPVQFAFDRGQLGGPPGLLALVASACTLARQPLQEQALEQARSQLQLPDLQALLTVVDKRATFACTPEVERPPGRIQPGLWACGDYIEGPYPATLEGAVLSALELVPALA